LAVLERRKSWSPQDVTILDPEYTLYSKKEFLTVFNNTIDNIVDPTSERKFFTIPYLNSISESFIPVIKKYCYDIAFTIPHTLNTFIKGGKDSLDPMSHLGVVYKMTFHDCNASYVGQTKRQLRTRIKEHVSDINKKNGSPSVISEHRLNFNHDFEWENIKITLDNEQSYKKK